MSLISRFVSVFSSRIVGTLIGILTTPIIVRFLGPGSFGDYAFILSVLSPAIVIANLGIPDGIKKYISQKSDREWQATVFGFYFKLGLITSLTVGGALTICVFLLQPRLSDIPLEALLFIPAIVLLTHFFGSFRATLRGLKYESISEPLNILQKVIFAILTVILLKFGAGLIGVLTANLIAVLSVTVIAALFVSKNILIPAATHTSIRRSPEIGMLRFNIFSIVLTLLASSLYHVDVVLLRILKGGAQTGFYKSALTIAEFLWLVPISLQAILVQSTSNLWESESTLKIEEIASNSMRINMAVTGIIAVGIFFLAEPFVSVYYGPGFTDAVLPLLILLPGAFGFGMARPILAILQAKGTLKPVVLVTGFVAGANLILNLALIPQYGMVGAGVATSIAYGLMFLCYILLAQHFGFNPIRKVDVLRVSAVTLTSGFVVYILSTILRDDLALVIVPLVGGGIHFYLCIKLNVISRAEANQTLSHLPEPIDNIGRRILNAIL